MPESTQPTQGYTHPSIAAPKCVDCKHFSRDKLLQHSGCAHPSAPRCLVTGELQMRCSDFRKYDSLDVPAALLGKYPPNCAPQGRFFEPLHAGHDATGSVNALSQSVADAGAHAVHGASVDKGAQQARMCHCEPGAETLVNVCFGQLEPVAHDFGGMLRVGHPGWNVHVDSQSEAAEPTSAGVDQQ